MKYLKAFILYSLIGVAAFAFGFYGASGLAYLMTEPDTTYKVKSELEPMFSYSCAVVPHNIDDFEGGGTGVVLKNGLILTAKHVVDANDNGVLDEKEKVVDIKFYYPKQYTMKGVVVYMPPGDMSPGKSMDFALVRPEQPVSSNIELATTEYFENVEMGEEIFTIGRTMVDELNIAVGYLAPPVPQLTCDRITISGWNGNSGGGIFVRKDGKLIGTFIIVRMHPFLGYNIPNWGGYQSAASIRAHLAENNLEHLLDVEDKKMNYYYLLLLLIPLIVITPYVILCKRMRQL